MSGIVCFDVGAERVGVKSRMTMGDDFLREGTQEKRLVEGTHFLTSKIRYVVLNSANSLNELGRGPQAPDENTSLASTLTLAL